MFSHDSRTRQRVLISLDTANPNMQVGGIKITDKTRAAAREMLKTAAK